MKIVISAQGPDRTSQVDPRFGRARNFIVFNSDDQTFSAHDNSQNLNAAQGAGIQAGRTAVDLGAEVVLTGNVGPKAFTTLAAAGVQICLGVSGTVEEAVRRFQAGELTPADKASVEGHWM